MGVDVMSAATAVPTFLAVTFFFHIPSLAFPTGDNVGVQQADRVRSYDLGYAMYRRGRGADRQGHQVPRRRLLFEKTEPAMTAGDSNDNLIYLQGVEVARVLLSWSLTL